MLDKIIKIIPGIILLLPFSVVFCQSGWVVDQGKYEYSMTITGVLSENNTLIENTQGIIVGAFNADSVCLGKAECQYFEKINKYRIPLIIRNNKNDDLVFLKAYLPEKDAVYEISKTIVFKIDEILGNYSTPVIWEIDVINSSTSALVDDQEIFPNPVGDELSIVLSNLNAKAHAVFFDITGKEVIRQEIYAGQGKIDVGFLREGIYLLRINDGSKVYTRKIIKINQLQ